MPATSTGVMAMAVLLALGASDDEAEAILAGELSRQAVPATPVQVLRDLSEELTRYRRVHRYGP